jgi:hypothetical protein
VQCSPHALQRVARSFRLWQQLDQHVLELELQLASVGAQQQLQLQESTGKGRAVALCLAAGCGVASLQRCRCVGTLTWGSLVCKRCRSGTPGTCLGVCVSQHNLSHPSTLCSEVCCPGALGVCVRFLTGGSPPVCVACFSGVEHCPWSPPFRQSLLQMLVVLGSILSVLCVPSILVLHKDPLFRTSRVPLRRSRLYDPCNTLLLDFLSFKATYVATMK